MDDIDVCFDLYEDGAAKAVSNAADCQGGEGEFKLAPWRFWDLDADGIGLSVLVPVQVGGTGVQTRAANVTEIEVLDDEGQELRVIRSGSTFRQDAGDGLQDAAAVSYLLTGTHTFTPGAVGGVPPFVVPNVAGSVPVSAELYGASGYSVTRPTHAAPGGGRSFLFKFGGVEVAGVWLGTNQTSATVRLDAMKWRGNSVCTPGTYSLPPE